MLSGRSIQAAVRLLIRRRTLYPAEVRDHMLEILILQGFRAYPVILTEVRNWGFRVSCLTAGGVFDYRRPFIVRRVLAVWR